MAQIPIGLHNWNFWCVIGFDKTMNRFVLLSYKVDRKDAEALVPRLSDTWTNVMVVEQRVLHPTLTLLNG